MPAGERRFALVRIRRGDYLLLGNDGRTVWRIATYAEDGSAVTDDGRKLEGEFWGTWRYIGRAGVTIDPDAWEDFEMTDCLLPTRAAAIASTLAMSPEPGV